jgi:hypothetical protein
MKSSYKLYLSTIDRILMNLIWKIARKTSSTRTNRNDDAEALQRYASFWELHKISLINQHQSAMRNRSLNRMINWLSLITHWGFEYTSSLLWSLFILFYCLFISSLFVFSKTTQKHIKTSIHLRIGSLQSRDA